MPAIDLTTDRIARLQPRERPYDTRDKKFPGHLVRTQPTGEKDFYYCYRRRSDRRQQYYYIGPVQIGLAASRDIFRHLAAEVAAGGDPAGRRREERRAAGAAREARKEAKRRKDAGEGDDPQQYRRFGDYLHGLYARQVEVEQKRGEETVARLEAAFVGFLALDLTEITNDRVKNWRNERQRAGIARTTIDRDVGALCTALRQAVPKLLPVYPLDKIKPLVKASAKLNHVRYLSDEEEIRLRGALRARDAAIRAKRERMNTWLAARNQPPLPPVPAHFADHIEPMVLVLLGTGLRFGELTHLRWGNVNFQSRMLIVDGATAKSGLTRHAPMPGEVLSILSRWRTRSWGAPMNLVFPGKGGRPLVDMKTAWSSILRDAGIERFRLHDLRHSYASRLVQRGVSLFTVQKLLGHASPTMTMRYAHLAPDHLADAVAVLDRPQQPASIAAAV